MATPSATLNGNRVTSARLTIPAWGASYHDVSIDGEITLTGAVSLVVADLTISGTVLSGGPGTGRSFFRVVAGAGGWGKSLPKLAYQNDAGVRLLTVLNDAATAAGETLDPTTIDPTATLGLYFVRPAGPACRVLEQLAPSAWYVGEDGKTRLGARPSTVLGSTAARVSQLDRARGTLTLASDTIATILPGISVDGLTAVDVEHEISAKDGLRTKIWGAQGGTSRRVTAFRALLDQLDPGRKFRGLYEYRVVTQNGNRLNLQSVLVSTGMPDLTNVVMRPGVAGANMQPALGSRVLVGFVNADPSRPCVLGFEDPDGAGFVPLSVTIGAAPGGGSAAARTGDTVTITQAELNTAGANAGGTAITISQSIQATITGGSSKVKLG